MTGKPEQLIIHSSNGDKLTFAEFAGTIACTPITQRHGDAICIEHHYAVRLRNWLNKYLMDGEHG